MPYQDARQLVTHPVTCLDCHDPQTLALRVTRPAFLRGIQELAKSDDPVPHLPSVERWREGNRKQPYDPNRDASRQELRSLACGQCHVEYYFQGDRKLLTYPWHKGLKVEQIEAYYDSVEWKDWTHAKSGAPVLKAQHPEFELWSQGIHARSGVACADCHMPYKRDGAIKISDHHVRSPLLNISRACQQCHNYPESEILSRAEAIQNRTQALLSRAEDAVLAAISAIAAAKEGGANDETLQTARQLQRQAQWRLDFVAAENSLGFHAPQESARILAEAADLGRQSQIAALQSAKP
jgi:nitrite reductase (cytochrome c-552)